MEEPKIGGNALNFETRRVERVEYFQIVEEISDKLHSIGVYVFADIPAYRTKPDFGDIDILIHSDLPNRKEWIQKTFDPKEIYHNSNCFSFDYKDVQVDFIFTPLDEFVTSLYYFSYNDLGNLLGRVYHKLGCKFGHDGLTLVLRDGDYQIGEINLSKNIDDILEFGKYDVDRYHQGFNDLKEIFDYSMSSPYYAYQIFDLDNRNHTARIRDRKRPTYTKFLLYAQENRKEIEFIWNKDKSVYLDMILDYFDKRQEYDMMIARHQKKKDVKQLFNGQIVSEITGLSGKELGVFIAKFREVFNDEDLLKMTPDMIRVEVETIFKDFE